MTDFILIIKSLRYKLLHMDDVRANRDHCSDCLLTGAAVTGTARLQYRDKELNDINFIGYTANIAAIDTRTLLEGRYFTEPEDERSAFVCLIGADVVDGLLPARIPLEKRSASAMTSSRCSERSSASDRCLARIKTTL